MDREQVLIVAGFTLAAAWLLVQWSNTQQQPGDTADTQTGDSYAGATSEPTGLIDNILTMTRNALGLWHPPQKYAGQIAEAEQRYGLPTDMLARLLWQECRYREEIITGRVRSPAGALGIAQFMPATARDLGIDPLDPAQAIDAAARYLAGLYRQFGNWTEALAAYNWGQGNVQRKGLDAAPAETTDYFTQILADVNSANGTNWT